MIMTSERESRLRTSLVAAEACAEHAREVARRWGEEAERATSLAASIRALLADQRFAGRTGRVEGAETLSGDFSAS